MDSHHPSTAPLSPLWCSYLVPVLADPAAGEQGAGVQPAQQVEGQLQGQQAQEVPLQQRLQPGRQVAQLSGAALGDEPVQGSIPLLVAQSQEGRGDRVQPPLEGRVLHGGMRSHWQHLQGAGGHMTGGYYRSCCYWLLTPVDL